MRRVLTGLDRWVAEGPAVAGLAAGARVGLLAHPASVDARALHAVEVVGGSGGCRLLRLFAPEHGLYGHEQYMEPVDDRHDPHSGLPVVSLYGRDAASLRPAPGALDGLDAVLVDLQDVGSRYYTYVYTMAFLMEAAARDGVRVVVLDRPNPLGGVAVEGPVLREGWSSFVGGHALPVRHGMTIGELARMFDRERRIGCEPTIVPMRGWERTMEWEDTGLPWVPPSPNMPGPPTARVYPGGCLLEGTNVSEGRGTTLPFEQIGAPWLDGAELARRMRRERLDGVLFRSASFRPSWSAFEGQTCSGVQVLVSDRTTFRPFRTYLALLREARSLGAERFAWRATEYEFERERRAIDLLLGRPDLRPLLEAGAPIAEIEACWEGEPAAFRERRAEFELYGGDGGA